MGVVYARDSDGVLVPVKALHVLTEDAVLDTGTKEFLQMNDLAAAFLAAADAAYTDDNGATVSVIADYETPEGDADRPLGYPLTATSGNLYLQNEDNGMGWMMKAADTYIQNAINNAVPGSVSQYLVKDADGKLLENGRIKPTGKVRMVRFAGYVRNCRDLGGWACDGGTVKYGKLFRSAAVASGETWIDPQIAENIGIRHQIDFRNDSEANYITESTLGARVRYHRIPLELYYADCIAPGGGDYENLQQVMRTILDATVHDEGVIYNCSLGRDRTGTVTFLLLALLGVAQKDIDKDYELTGFSQMDTPAYRTSAAYQELIRSVMGLGEQSLRDNAVLWFLRAGFSLAELNAFRAAMSSGTPDVLEEDSFDRVYWIDNQLTGCRSSNTITSVWRGEAYSAVITCLDGFNTISSAKVTMGGVDVTAEVYAEGAITIPAVTGDVEIAVVAVYVAPYTNQIPISTDFDGSIYNGVGYSEGLRINYEGEIISSGGVYLTGFIPCAAGDEVRFANISIKESSYGTMMLRNGFYDENHAKIDTPYWENIFASCEIEKNASGNLVKLVVPSYSKEIAYARFSCYYLDRNSVITVNEEII